MKLQVSRASDPEILQSQVTRTARKRLSLSGLDVLHGQPDKFSKGGRAEEADPNVDWSEVDKGHSEVRRVVKFSTERTD
jgi:hypothetical protein